MKASVIALLVVFPLSQATATRPAPRTEEIVAGQIVVRWRQPKAFESLEPLMLTLRDRSLALRHQRTLFDSVSLMRLDGADRDATRAAAKTLAARPDVDYAHPVYVRRPTAAPSDPLYPLMWHAGLVRLPQTWDLTGGSSEVVVAVIDTGITRNHPDFGDRVLPGYDFVSTAADGGDGDGRDADPTDPGTPESNSSGQHGTHVAGIIGATANNNQGIAGVNWRCKILPVRALGVREGQGTDPDIADAIRWAAGLEVRGVPLNPTPAHVINLSFSGYGAAQVLTDAIRAAMNAGVIVVSAAGNDATSAEGYYPAAIPGVLAVAASGPDAQLASYSNYGSIIGILAPGGEMGVTIPFEGRQEPAGVWSLSYNPQTQQFGYRAYEGTSQAAPVVAGIASLMLAVYPGMKGEDVIRVIKETADSSKACPTGCGAGMIDAFAAVSGARELSPNPPPPVGEGALDYAQECSADLQCATQICRITPAAPLRICTQYCSFDHDCQSDSACEIGLCTPTQIARQPSSQAGPTKMVGVGCSAGGDGETPFTPGSWALLLLLVLLARQRRRDRQGGASI